MIGFFHKNAELDNLRETFNQKAMLAEADIKRLTGILDNLTSETCPLSPCDDCILVHCMLRRANIVS